MAAKPISYLAGSDNPWVTASDETGGSSGPIQARYLKLDEVATYLSVSEAQVYALVRSGELPAVKIGGRGVWRVDRHKLDTYLERLEEETAVWAKAHPFSAKGRADASGDDL